MVVEGVQYLEYHVATHFMIFSQRSQCAAVFKAGSFLVTSRRYRGMWVALVSTLRLGKLSYSKNATIITLLARLTPLRIEHTRKDEAEDELRLPS